MQNMRAEMEQQIKLFDGRKIRAAFDEKANEWLFSVIDVVEESLDIKVYDIVHMLYLYQPHTLRYGSFSGTVWAKTI